MQHAAGSKAFTEIGKLRVILLGVIALFGLFFGIEMVQIAKELIETMPRW